MHRFNPNSNHLLRHIASLCVLVLFISSGNPLVWAAAFRQMGERQVDTEYWELMEGRETPPDTTIQFSQHENTCARALA